MDNSLEKAIRDLRSGRLVLLHDADNRENEVDMILPAQFVTPKDIAMMREDAGGLICLAIDHESSQKLGLFYMHDLLKKEKGMFNLIKKKSAYGDFSSFSITINHNDTFTGISDQDRALTIKTMSDICNLSNINCRDRFTENYRSPGHVSLLIAAKNLLRDRRGHTEFSIFLMKLAGLTPCVIVCEMLDSQTYKSLTLVKAIEYAKKFNLSLLEGKELLEEYQEYVISK